ncbi:corrinoid protein [Synergistes jonesii]|uniref:Methyltransferase n=2 Tax=Synergistes jonesii TaxID=2754 RepID=A0A073ILQ4_9BACT|nr:corrinoid protein [Synergistes jonesii]KEJ91258.1 methyltransferase [Synergistes jonesii]OFB60268.1 methyltransferase [Synergistes jonesii]OFB65629.1 methyltransferase [Synergistes jonesii]OFB66210.1 methyltransferase [Synergistes jonesii]OFB66545.1 methyltransferase [Synergistes jonesii]
MSQILETIAGALADGAVDNVKNGVRKAIDDGVSAKDILSKGLISGMDKVGLLFKDGEMFVPEVLVAAKAMQAGLEIIKPLLLSDGVQSVGKILMVTVEGDLHDIGVKLVGMMLEGAGFEVINLGVDIPAAKIIEKVKELRPDILGLSAMLTTTMASMKNVMDALKEEGLLDNIKVMVGGAPLSPMYAEKIGAHYSADSNEAVFLAKSLIKKT